MRPLDEIDFETRAWVPHSGWPLRRQDLDPYYERARQLLGLPEQPFDPAAWLTQADLSFAASDRFESAVRQIVREDHRRLGPRLLPSLRRADNLTTLLHANVLRLELSESRRAVSGAALRTLGGKRFRVSARRFVLATGGIENARILLLSSIASGAESGARGVGAFFANHPEGWAGYLQPGAAPIPAGWFTPKSHAAGRVGPLLRPSAKLQREAELLNCWIQPLGLDGQAVRAALDRESLAPARRTKPALRDADVTALARDLDGPGPGGGRGGPFAASVGVRVFSEPAPAPESRVRLGRERDAFGQQKVELDWQLSPRCSESTRRTLQLFARAIGAAGIGRLRVLFPESGFESIRTVSSHHHMGTTRMHDDPRHGIVDAQCRVHGIDNLYVAGSSVFPTYGTANPTYTLLALAFRLADHLQGVQA